jgi:AcrR family transcriptional regulator
VERLRARRSEIDEAIFARVRDVAPDQVGFGDPEYVAGLRAAISAAVGYVLGGIEQGREFSPRIPSAAVAQARRAACLGVGLDTVLRRYVAAYTVLEDFIMQETDHSDFAGQRIAVRWVLETSASLLDRLITSITSAYMQEQERIGSTHHAPGRGQRKQGGDGGGFSTTDEHVVQDKRARIMQALADVLAERGFAGATIALVVTRARVSTRTFYELFAGLENCLIAIMDSVLERVVALASRELARAECWQDGVRSALAAVLTFFDREPRLARVCIVETLAAGPVVLKHREAVIEAFRLPIIERISRDVPVIAPLTAEGVMNSVLGIMHGHIVTDEPGPFIEMLGPLMALATAPYMGAWRVERESERGDAHAQAILNRGSPWTLPARAKGQNTELEVGQGVVLPAMLGNPSARRARECLRFLAVQGGRGFSPSNREVAVGIDITHQSQISKLLAYLSQEGLVTKCSEGRGKRNAWRLTPYGEEIARTLQQRD